MQGCKEQILKSIPNNTCCSHAFFSTLLYSCSQIDIKTSSIIINTKPEYIEKLTKILRNFYPSLEHNLWDDFLVINGDLSQLLNDCNVDDTLNFNFGIFQDECCKLTILKTLFLSNGNFYYTEDNSANSKGYSFELAVKKENEDFVNNLLISQGFELKKNVRPNSVAFYTKNSAMICDILVKFGASLTALNIKSNLAIREMRNNINRQNNCFGYNLDKTLNASSEQMEAINYLMETNQIDFLDEGLKEVAMVRFANPDVSLNDLKTLLGGKISRAGIKYRLDKIIAYYISQKGEN